MNDQTRNIRKRPQVVFHSRAFIGSALRFGVEYMRCQVRNCEEDSMVIVHYPTNNDEIELCQKHYDLWIYHDFKRMPLKDGVIVKQ